MVIQPDIRKARSTQENFGIKQYIQPVHNKQCRSSVIRQTAGGGGRQIYLAGTLNVNERQLQQAAVSLVLYLFLL